MNSAEIRRIQMALTTINERISGVENDISELQKLKEKVSSFRKNSILKISGSWHSRSCL